MENEQEFEQEVSHQGDAPSANGQLPSEINHMESEQQQPSEQNRSVAGSNNDPESNPRQSRRAPTFGGATGDNNSKQQKLSDQPSQSYAPRSHYSQFTQPKSYHQDYERTKQVLENARARSREMQRLEPSKGNGYERTGGSPQRMSPGRKGGYATSFVSKGDISTQAQTHAFKENHSRVQHSTSPFNENSINMRHSVQHEQQSVNIMNVSRSNEFHGKENDNKRSSQSRERTHSKPRIESVSHMPTQPGPSNIPRIHDQIINSYRRQISANSNLQHEYEALKIKIAEISQKRNQLEDSIRYLQQDYEKQIEGQDKDIAMLQGELDNLKRLNSELGQEGNAVNSDIIDSKQTLNQREVEIQKLRADLSRGADEGRFVKDGIEECRRYLRDNYALKEQQHQKLYQLQAQLKGQENSNFSLTSESNEKTNQLNQLNSRIRSMDEQNHDVCMRLDDTSCKFDIARAEVSRHQSECQCLQQDCDAGNQRNTYLMETQRQLIRQRDGEGQKGQELNNDMVKAENRFAQLDSELCCIGKELEAVRTSNEGLLETGHCYKQELHALQNHADILALQNNDLQRELDEFVLTDDMIKSSLDRKGRVQTIKQRVEDTIVQSHIELDKSRSPRRASRSPLENQTNKTVRSSANSLTAAYMQQQQQNYQPQLSNQASVKSFARAGAHQENYNQYMSNASNRKEGSLDYRVGNGSPLRRSQSPKRQ